MTRAAKPFAAIWFPGPERRFAWAVAPCPPLEIQPQAETITIRVVHQTTIVIVLDGGHSVLNGRHPSPPSGARSHAFEFVHTLVPTLQHGHASSRCGCGENTQAISR